MVPLRPDWTRSEILLELVGISKTFEGKGAVFDLNLTVPRGRTTVLIGPSGSGKSTVLRLLNGLIEPESGDVLFDSVRLTRESVRPIRRRMGYMVQSGGLFPHLTCRQNIELAARHFGMTSPARAERLAELAALTRYPEDALDRFPARISGGQRQRAALMRALFLDPDVLLLDEPLGALDPLVRRDLSEDLRRIFLTLSKTVVFVTHDMAEAAFFGDSVVLLSGGRIAQAGKLRDLRERPATPFVSDFLRAELPPVDA